jgi:hypothetical protein
MKRTFYFFLGLALIAGCSYDPPLTSDNSGQTGSTVSVSDTTNVPAVPARELAPASEYKFQSPIQLMAGNNPIAVESPGFAAPTMADVDGDGADDLVVGQFASGKMWMFKNVAAKDAAPEFAKADWIKTGSDPAIVPGVW